MAEMKLYTPIPKNLLREGMILSFNIFVFLPQNESLIHYRKKGDLISLNDIKFFDKVPPINLLVPREEAKIISDLQAKQVSAQIAKGNLDSVEVKATVNSTLNALGANENIAQSIEAVGPFVQSLISSFKSSPSVNAFDEALKRAAAKGNDPLTIHQHQVSSIAVLMALLIGNFSMDDLSDIAAAGMIHDIGMMDITHSLADNHIKGNFQMSNPEKLVYMRHPEFSVERAKKEKIPITSGIQRIIELHHENWDGTGFKNYAGNKTFRPARVIRIADDFVSMIQDVSQKLTFHQTVQMMIQKKGWYDPEMLQALISHA